MPYARCAAAYEGLHNAVQVLVFSDEVGIHVGDIDELDVGGGPLAVRSRK